MAELTGAEVLVKALKNEGVRHVFGISGHGIVALIEALRKEEGIDFICPRQESASHMADIVNNDGGWGMIKAGQLAPYGENAVEGID